MLCSSVQVSCYSHWFTKIHLYLWGHGSCRVAVERSAVLLHPVIRAQFFHPMASLSVTCLPPLALLFPAVRLGTECVEHHRKVLHAAIYGSVIDSSFCFLLVRSQSRDLTLLQRHWGISCLKEEERCGFLSFSLPNILSFHSFLSMKYPKPLSKRVNTKSPFVNTLKSEISGHYSILSIVLVGS